MLLHSTSVVGGGGVHPPEMTREAIKVNSLESSKNGSNPPKS